MASEADVKAAVLNSASENSVLLVKLSSTSSAPALLAGHEKHVSHLKDELTSQIAVLDKLKEAIDTKFQRHKKFRHSKTRRFVYRATNMLAKFDAKALKEEREYFELLGTQSKTDMRIVELQKTYDDALKAQEPLEAAVEQHRVTHERIDELYEGLFAGPTPGFPGEDEREHRFNTARGRNGGSIETIRALRRVLKLLANSKGHVKRAQVQLRNAEQHAVDSLFFLDDALDSLQRASEHVIHAINITGRIEQELNPPVSEIMVAKVEVDRNLNAANFSFDLTNSRETIISTVTSSLTSLLSAEAAIEKLIVLTKAKEQATLEELRGNARELEDTRQELHQTRQGIFEKVAGFGEAAPAYHECCDRAEQFCEVPEEPIQEDPERERGPSPDDASASNSAPPGY